MRAGEGRGVERESAVRVIRPLRAGWAPDAEVRVPGSKSLTNRALVLAALAQGASVLQGALRSDDSAACAGALRAVGVRVEADAERPEFRVEGVGGGPPALQAEVNVGLSGTTARFLCPWLALGQGVYRVDGVPRMRQRPMGAVWEALRLQGVRIDGGPNLPFTIHGGALAGGELHVAGGETSQPASGLLMAAPHARQDTILRVATHRTSLPFVEMTVAVMAEFGVHCARLPADGEAESGWRVPAGQRYAGRVYAVEPDASSAAYFWALAALTGGRVRTPGIGRSQLQGDAGLLRILEEMGCRVTAGAGGAEVCGPPGGRLRGGDWDLSALGDQTLTLAVLGLFGDRPTTVRNVAHIRLQETDRIAAAAAELRRLGARCEERPDGFTVWPLRAGSSSEVAVDSHGDHRVAMSFALAGLRRPGLAIRDPSVVAKTYPGFFAELERVSGGA